MATLVGLMLGGALAATTATGAGADDGHPSPTGGSPTGNKLLLTGGLSQVEGSAGGGLVPWAVIGGYGTRDEIGANAFYTRQSA